MRRIDFITLKLFSTIADELNLTKAAEREHLALAAVSKRITDLEDELGVQPLYRLARTKFTIAAPYRPTFLSWCRKAVWSLT